MGVCLSCNNLNIEKSNLDFTVNKGILDYSTYDPATEIKSAGDRTKIPWQNTGYNKMANTISNMKMTNPIKNLVSKKRRRYVQDGYNLDLTYIRDNLIAMGYPAEKLEGVYRNHIDDVVKFLENKHKDHYKIYNLCSERSYDVNKFQSRVATYAFDDHNPPKIELIRPFCDDVHKWLSADSKNVAAVHCKAGKGRTGVMICCYMLHNKTFLKAEDALNYYGQKRTHDRKGVTIPSQRRYVGYCADLVRENLEYKATTLVIKEIRLSPVPLFNGGQGCMMLAISNATGKIFESQVYEVKKGAATMNLRLDKNIELTGDIKIDFFSRPKMKRKEKMFHFWFNTFFVRDEVDFSVSNGNNDLHQHHAERSTRSLSCEEQSKNEQIKSSRTNSLTTIDYDTKLLVLRLNKCELDDAHKDKQHKIYTSDFQVSLFFNKVPHACVKSVDETTTMSHEFTETPSESSDAESSDSSTEEGEEDGWESGESTYL